MYIYTVHGIHNPQMPQPGIQKTQKNHSLVSILQGVNGAAGRKGIYIV